MDRDKIIELLENVKQGTVETNEAMEQLRKLPFQIWDFAKIDHHRATPNRLSRSCFLSE